MSNAEDHVDWWIKSIRPLLIDFYEHGRKHGLADAVKGSLERLLSKDGDRAKEYPKDATWAKCGSDGWKMKDGFTKDGFPRNNEEHVRQMYEAGP